MKQKQSTHLSRLELSPHWPWSASRWPFFYGWVIWLFSTLGFLASIPGQTMGMAVFTEPFIAAFGLSRTQLSMAYLVGTLGSALLLTRAGRLYDRVGARLMIAGASVVLGLTLLFISGIDYIAEGLGAGPVTMFCLITVGYFGVRFSGQGVLTSASRNVLLSWFEARRGLVSGIRGIFVALGFSLAPLILAALIAPWGWRAALWILGAAVGMGFALLALLFIRNTPAQCGLQVDGVVTGTSTSGNRSVQTHRGIDEARRDPVFWVYAASLSMHSMFITALTFHIVAIFAESGRSSQQAFAFFLPTAVVSTAVNFAAGWLADRYRLKPFLLLMLLAFISGAGGLLLLSSNLGYALLVIGFGAGGGLWGVLSNLAFVRFYGLLHLGEISGLNASLMVFGSAVGPALFSLTQDWSGSFLVAKILCLGLLLLLLLVAMKIPQQELSAQRL